MEGGLRRLLGATLWVSLACTGCRGGGAPAAADTTAPAEKAPLASATGGFDGAKAYEHVAKLVAIGPRTPGTEGIRRAQGYIREQLQSFGCTVTEDDFHASTPIGSVPMKNFLVTIPGASANVILLATHYDTKRIDGFVGADDGGSSTGVMLEMARLLCARKNDLTIWIAFFDGEEAFGEWSDSNGTFGSREMAAKLALDGNLTRVKVMLLADLVGSRNLRVQRESNSTPWVTDLVWATAARLGYSTIFVPQQIAVEDDHLPFLRRGVPAADVIDLEVPYWHTTGDTLDKISPRSLATVGHVLVESIPELEKKLR